MKKKLISLAVASVLATPAVVSAQGTNVTLFGSAQAEYSTVDIDKTSSQAVIGDDTGRSRWGMHVSENLGAGLKAKAHIEYGLNLGNGNIGIARERWVGLANDGWGEVKFGRVQSPFKDFAGGMTIDPFAYTSLQAGGSGGTMVASANGLGSGAQGFVNSAARYDSPLVEGFAFSALLMPGDANRLDPALFGVGNQQNQPGGLNSGGEDGEWDFQIAGKYSSQYAGHGFDVFGGYSRDNVSTQQRRLIAGNVDDEEVWRGGASWSFADFKLSGQYENINNAVGAATCTSGAMMGIAGDSRAQCNSAMNLNGDGHVWFTGGEYKIGNTRLVAQGGMTHARKVSGFNSTKDARSFTVGAIHNLSRRSSVFGGYQRVDVKDHAPGVADADRNTYTAGIRHDF
ncbi:MAG: porin [Nitrosomonas sp.]|nr:porin [Nitrosomonas sp.]MDP1949897.1 porin [Nitrosomonas sp.]